MKLHPKPLLALGVLSAGLFIGPEIASAQATLRPLPSDGTRLGELLSRLPKPAEGQLRPKVIGLDSADTSFVFAAAGSVLSWSSHASQP